MEKSIYILISLFLIFCADLNAQQDQDTSRIIQFSGVVTVEEGGEILPLPFATVAVKGTSRGTVTEIDGFFSLVVLTGEIVQIRSLGFRTEELVIPDTAAADYSLIINLEKEAQELPLIEILPIPSREFFKQEFLAMNVEAPLQSKARENLDANLMNQIRETLPPDGTETARLQLRQTAQQYYSFGQFKPQNVLNAFAWKKFIEAWKRGDFKNKNDDEER